MSLIQRPVRVIGSHGSRSVTALFDSGATHTCIDRALAEQLDTLSEPMAFETAEAEELMIARWVVPLDLYFPDSRRRFTDVFIVLDRLSEPLIIGAHSMQAWQVRLDFVTEDVIYDRSVQRLRI